MGSRERKRAERRKRKRRGARAAPRDEAASGDTAEAPGGGNGETQKLSRSQIKDAEARASLEPLREGERPAAVTIGAIVSTALLALTALGYVLWPVLRDDSRPAVFGVVVFSVLMGAMAYGMWRARYWAVLGFQVFLVFFLIAVTRGLVLATTVGEVVGNSVLMAGGGTLFYFMVKALARIQMPERLPRE